MLPLLPDQLDVPRRRAPRSPTPLSTPTTAPCRSVNVILVTDGDETCDTQADAVDAAADLYIAGVTIGGNAFSVKTYVINFAGGNQAANATTSRTPARRNPANRIRLLRDQRDAALAGALQHHRGRDQARGLRQHRQQLQRLHRRGLQPLLQRQPSRDLLRLDDARAAHDLPHELPDLDHRRPFPAATSTLLAVHDGRCSRRSPANWLCFDPARGLRQRRQQLQRRRRRGHHQVRQPARTAPRAEICNGAGRRLRRHHRRRARQSDPFSMRCTSASHRPRSATAATTTATASPTTASRRSPAASPPPANCAGSSTCRPPTAVPSAGGCVPGGGFRALHATTRRPRSATASTTTATASSTTASPPTPCVPAERAAGLDLPARTQPVQAQVQARPAALQRHVRGLGRARRRDLRRHRQRLRRAGRRRPCPASASRAASTGCRARRGTTACVSGALVCQGGIAAPARGVRRHRQRLRRLTSTRRRSPTRPPPAAERLLGRPAAQLLHRTQNLQLVPAAGRHLQRHRHARCAVQQGHARLRRRRTAGRVWNPKRSEPEVCDGVDNDCNGPSTTGLGPQVGQPCGSSVRRVRAGRSWSAPTACSTASGDVGPTPESLRRPRQRLRRHDRQRHPDRRRRCPAATTRRCTRATARDGACPTGRPASATAWAARPASAASGPSPRSATATTTTATAQIDETGAAPDGIDGTPNPFPPPAGSIGDACGSSVGECTHGHVGCVNGRFVCVGAARAPTPERLRLPRQRLQRRRPTTARRRRRALRSARARRLRQGRRRRASARSRAAAASSPARFRPAARRWSRATTLQPPAGNAALCMIPAGTAPKTHQGEAVEQGDVECAPLGTVLDVGFPGPVRVQAPGCRGPCVGIRTVQAARCCVPVRAREGQLPAARQLLTSSAARRARRATTARASTIRAARIRVQRTRCASPRRTSRATRCVGSCAARPVRPATSASTGPARRPGCGQGCPAGEVCQNRDGGNVCGPTWCR